MVDDPMPKHERLFVLGRSGIQKLKDPFFKSRAIRESIVDYLRRREMALGQSWESTQDEVLLGMGTWLLNEQRPLSELERYEAMLNHRLQWGPRSQLLMALHPIHTSLCTALELTATLMHSETSDLSLDELPRLARLTRSFRDHPLIERGAFWHLYREMLRMERKDENILRRILNRTPKPEVGPHKPGRFSTLLNQAQEILRYFPEVMDEHLVETLSRLTDPKPEPFVMTHAPGRFAILPVVPYTRLGYPPPDYSFVLAYMAVSPDTRDMLQGHEKFRQSTRAKHKHEGTKPKRGEAPLYYEIAGIYPGALAYGRVSVYKRHENRPRTEVSLDLVMSDVVSHAREYVDANVLQRMVIPMIAFGRFFDPDRMYYPCFETALANAHLRDIRRSGRLADHPLTHRFGQLYGEPPAGWSGKITEFGGQRYWTQDFARPQRRKLRRPTDPENPRNLPFG